MEEERGGEVRGPRGQARMERTCSHLVRIPGEDRQKGGRVGAVIAGETAGLRIFQG